MVNVIMEPYPLGVMAVSGRVGQREVRGVLEGNGRHGDGQSFQTGEEGPTDIGGTGGSEGKEDGAVNPLCQVPHGGGQIGYADAPLTSTELRAIRNQLPKLTEDP